MKTFLCICLITYLTSALSANDWPISLDMACNKALSVVACTFEFTNNANEDLYLLKHGTPLEGLVSQFLTVSVADSPVEYDGPFIHRLPPTKDEFVLLKAGESISASVQITDAFSIDTDGIYTVQYSRPLQYLSVNEMSELSNGLIRESTVQESIHIYLEDTHVLLKPRRPDETDKVDYTVNIESCSSASFTGGTAANNKGTLDAHKQLCSGIDRVNITNNDLYKKWFGAFTAAREKKVKAVYKKMRDGLAGNTVTYVNGGPHCKPNTYGYTYHNVKKVHICPAFYTFPVSCGSPGTYTKEFGLIHEWSHAFGLTVDNVYGSSQSQNLAKTNPDKAVANADNYGWHYCEWQ
ncbi:PREDICTED: uncharacterized protein LOC109583643 isoform X2 [Amphimedon queenslandica]|uniref:Lysine-specific metallo-endopeptidase domain-containing protein n=1 Tax=Amphimedon queenslandica TaxID=400682 RepID=A0AAN0JD02_AMPQE|nr:PREDICTED: uncharacterized protein LOC109583643 isoform X2 [Amphimedon queenslandica]|eukprot:XP_019854626.1 PREDICTED: uncharacterized protein LOC109583643 isoform X2 [Amphimedon queenslandica]